MSRIYHVPEQVIPEVNLELTSCSGRCPEYEVRDGMGHCDDSTHCKAMGGKEIWNYSVKTVEGFPETCPLKVKLPPKGYYWFQEGTSVVVLHEESGSTRFDEEKIIEEIREVRTIIQRNFAPAIMIKRLIVLKEGLELLCAP